VNLRQALYQLRKALGPDTVCADAAKCWLGEYFEFENSKPPTRFHDPKLVTIESGHIRSGATPVAGFIQLLKWFAENDPAQMIDLMRSNMDLVLGMWPAEMTELLTTAGNRARIDQYLAGWLSFWRGIERVCSDDIDRARQLFSVSCDIGTEAKDHLLVVESLCWLGTSEILLRRFQSAMRMADRASQVATASADPFLRAKVQHLQASILIHQSRTKEGLDLLQQVSDAVEDRVFEHAQNEALRGLYNACTGQTRVATEILEHPVRLAEETGHYRLQAICDLANGYVRVWEGEHEKAIELLEQLLAHSARARTPHFEIYGREAIAVALWQSREQPDAVTQLKKSHRLRRSLSMAYTDWDTNRLKPMKDAVLSA
jgi:tetratricopeptide (TPR) repeat protein